MSLTPSTMLGLGTIAPDFKLPDVTSGEMISLGTFRDKKAVLVMFICAHCPFVKHIQDELAKIGQDYQPLGVGIVAISANSIKTHPQDGPEHLKTQADTVGFSFPYCYDETQEVAKAYAAACTPDFFLFNSDRQLVYRGQLDDSRPGNNLPVTGEDLRKALDAIIADKAITTDQKPSIGCNIKWHPQ